MPFVEERRVGEDEDGVQWGQVGYVFVCCQGSIKLFKNGGCPDEDHALSYMSLRARTTMASPRGRGRSLHGSQGWGMQTVGMWASQNIDSFKMSYSIFIL